MVFAQLIGAFVCTKLTDFILAVSCENKLFADANKLQNRTFVCAKKTDFK